MPAAGKKYVVTFVHSKNHHVKIYAVYLKYKSVHFFLKYWYLTKLQILMVKMK